MKLVSFRCNNPECKYQEEDLFNTTEPIPYMLSHYCPMCGGILYKFNFKDNAQVWQFNDKR